MLKKIKFNQFLSTVTVPIYGFIIVNPMGPTFMGFALTAQKKNKSELVFFSLNPFEQKAEQVTVYNYDTKSKNIDETIFEKLTISEDISNFLSSDNYNISTPTLLFGVFEGRTDYSIRVQRKIIFDIVKYSSNPHQTLSNLEKFPLNVMDRVSYEMKGLNSEDNEKKIKDKSIQKIISIICHPNHIKQEFQGFLIAWDGSIEFQKNNGNNDLADISLDMKSALSFIAKLFPSLIELLMEDYPNK